MGPTDRNDFSLGALEERVMFSGVLAGAGATAMAYDASGVLHVAYYDPVKVNLKYTTRTANGAWTPAVTVDAARGVGSQLSLAVDAAGRPAVAYYDAANKDLKYARLDGTKWSRLTVDGAGKVGRNPSLAFNADGLPLISYYDQGGQDLRIASFNGRKWYVSTIDAAGSVGQFSSLAISPLDGSWAVAYESQTGRGIKFVQQRRKSFSVATIASLGATGGDWSSRPSLAFDASGRAAVGYADAAQDAVRLTLAARRGWSTVTVVAGAGVANDAVVSFDSSSSLPQVAYLDRSGQVSLARSTGAGTWGVSIVGQADYVTAAVNPVTGGLALVTGGGTTQVDAVLAAPTGLRQDPAVPQRVHETSVQWNGVGGVTGYELERSADGGATWAAVSEAPLPAGTTSFVDSGLRESVGYRYRVRAVSATGASGWSAVAVVATAAFHVLNDGKAAYDSARTAEYTHYAGIDRAYMADTRPDLVQNADGSVNRAAVAGYVNEAVSEGRHIFVYDLEELLLDIRTQGEATVRARLAFLKALVAESKTYLPAGYDMAFGFWAITDLAPPEDMTNAERVLEWRRAVDFLIGKGADGSNDPGGASHDVRTFMDFSAPGAYTNQDPATWGRDTMRRLLELKRLQLPVYAWLSPIHVDDEQVSAPVSGDRWRYQIEMVRQVADGLDIWQGNPAWMPTSPWWTVTKAFLDPSALVGSAPAAPTTPVVSATGAISWQPGGGAASGYVIEKGRDDGAGGWTWEVVGVTPDTTWQDPWVQVGAQYRYRIRAQNRYGLSDPLTFAPLVGRRDAFAVIPVGSYDSRVSGPAYANASGEHLRLHWMFDGDYVRYENVVFTRQPYAMDLWVRSYVPEAGGVLELWLDRGTRKAIKLGSLAYTSVGLTENDPPLTLQRMLLRPDVDLTRSHVMDLVFDNVLVDGELRNEQVRVDRFQIIDASPTQDVSSGGAWRAGYGGQGAWLASDSADTSLSVADLVLRGASGGDWGETAVGAPDRADGAGRSGAYVYAADAFTVDVGFRDDGSHRLTAYFFAGDGQSRTQRVEILRQSVEGGAFDTVVDSRTLTDFTAGTYLNWVVAGRVQIRVTALDGPDAVLGGVFVDDPGQFVGTDASTRGDWKGTYGSEFAYITQTQSQRPDYLATFEFLHYDDWASQWSWNHAPADPTQLPLTIDGQNGERAMTYEHWEHFANCVLDIDLTDDRMHQLSLFFNYVVPSYPGGSPTQVVEIYNADDDTLIDSQRVDHFASGKYLSWNVSGRVRVRIYSLDGNTFLTGVFLDPVASSAGATGAAAGEAVGAVAA